LQISILELILCLVSRKQLVPSEVAGGEKAEATAGKKKAFTCFRAPTPALPHILVSSHQLQLAHTVFPFPLCPKPGVSYLRAPPPRCLRLSAMAGSSSDPGLSSKLSCRQALTHSEQRALQKSCRLHQPKYNLGGSGSRITSNAKVSEL